jgi:hypothetical protein
MKNLLYDYLMAVAATTEVDLSSPAFDRVVACEVMAEEALRRHVKIAARVHPSRPVKHPVAAYICGALVVVVPTEGEDQLEKLHIVHPRHIVRGE